MSPIYLPIIIFMIPFACALLTPLFRRNPAACFAIPMAATAGSFLFSLQALRAVSSGTVVSHYMGGWLPPYGIEWRLDSLSAVMALLITSLAMVVIFATREPVSREVRSGQVPYYMALLLNLSGMLGMIFTHDLFNLFVFLEVTSLTTYALVATGDVKKSTAASLRYLLIGTVGASFYLLGVGYLYAATGTLNMSDMASRLVQVADSRSVWLGLLLIFTGLSIKMGLFPFHGWLPDAYAHASHPAASFIAPTATKVSIFIFLRIFMTLIGEEGMVSFGLTRILTGLGILAMLTGSVFAFSQTRLRRMLAYSSISHIGLIILAVGLNEKTALIGAVLHIINHAAMKASLFLIAQGAYQKHGITDILDLNLLRGKMPHTMRAFAVASLSMIGIPPFCGFFSKWYILVGAVQAGNLVAAGLIVFSSLLTALYFFRLIEITFYQKKEGAEAAGEPAFPLLFSYKLLSVLIVALGLGAPWIYRWGLNTWVW